MRLCGGTETCAGRSGASDVVPSGGLGEVRYKCCHCFGAREKSAWRNNLQASDDTSSGTVNIAVMAPNGTVKFAVTLPRSVRLRCWFSGGSRAIEFAPRRCLTIQREFANARVQFGLTAVEGSL